LEEGRRLKVFISWSGALSHHIALALHDWLPQVIQVFEPFLSSEDIVKGTPWFSRISTELDSCSHGIIVVTTENYSRPWLNFEAGALSKTLLATGGIVAPLLIEVSERDLAGPLTQLQLTPLTKPELRKLLRDLNSRLTVPLRESVLDASFAAMWHFLEEAVKVAIQESANIAPPPRRSNDEVLDEILQAVRGMSVAKPVQRNFVDEGETERPAEYDLMTDPQHALDVIFKELLEAGFAPNRFDVVPRDGGGLQLVAYADSATASPTLMTLVGRVIEARTGWKVDVRPSGFFAGKPVEPTPEPISEIIRPRSYPERKSIYYAGTLFIALRATHTVSLGLWRRVMLLASAIVDLEGRRHSLTIG
jgi:hypothetical protein